MRIYYYTCKGFSQKLILYIKIKLIRVYKHLYSGVQFSCKLTVKFVFCNVKRPLVSRNQATEFVVCNTQGPLSSRKVKAKFVLCNAQGP